ncbi:MAG: large conductance mechanosensitive channel protein MscL [Anaerorhabdus sp.]
MKNFIKEFKEFAFKGNMIEVAIGLVMGAAFKDLVNVFIEAIISPVIGLLFNQNLSNITVTLGSVIFPVGILLSTIINFILTAFVLFLFIKAVNRSRKAKVEEKVEAVTSEEVLLLREIAKTLKK